MFILGDLVLTKVELNVSFFEIQKFVTLPCKLELNFFLFFNELIITAMHSSIVILSPFLKQAEKRIDY